MRILLRIVGGLAALFVLVMGGSMIASESGEVVVLRTPDPATETRLWVVDEAGAQWLRAGGPTSSWLLAIHKNPAVEVERAGQTATYTAVPDVASRDRINPLFAEKYGWADAYIAALFGRDDATPIRLDPAL
jgi:hypothetical protein